jgi:hypothetical protein
MDIANGAVDRRGLVLEQSCLVGELLVALFVHAITAQGRSMDFWWRDTLVKRGSSAKPRSQSQQRNSVTGTEERRSQNLCRNCIL